MAINNVSDAFELDMEVIVEPVLNKGCLGSSSMLICQTQTAPIK